MGLKLMINKIPLKYLQNKGILKIIKKYHWKERGKNKRIFYLWFMYCLGYISYCWSKIPWLKQLKKGFILAYNSQVYWQGNQSVKSLKWQVTLHTLSGSRVTSTLMLRSLSPFHAFQDTLQRKWSHLKLRRVFPHQLT